MRLRSVALAGALAAACGGSVQDAPGDAQGSDSIQARFAEGMPPGSPRDVRPDGKGFAVKGARPTRGNGISYHGGPVMTAGPNIHYIWYGNWSSTAQSILNTFASGIGGSPYFGINTTYYDANGVRVANSASFAAASADNYSRGTSLSDADIQAIVAASNPTDTNGIYFVLTSADVDETSGFCTKYCGWHTHGTINGRDIKYSFVGNPARCPSACTNGTPPPNGDVGADGAASIIAHELEEATTDPDLNAWYDNRGYENADKCAWTFGSTYTTGTGGVANMNLGGRDFLIQQNWVNASGGYCSTHYP